MKTAYVFLADGFEEIEAVAPIDLMRRAGITVHTVGVTGKTVTGGHGIPVVADRTADGFALPGDADLVVLPGGGAGVRNLAKSPVISQVLQQAQGRDILVAAICAAPTILSGEGMLKGKRATVFPDYKNDLDAKESTGAAVEVDGKVITARSAGVALEFAHALITALLDKNTADKTLESVYPAHNI